VTDILLSHKYGGRLAAKLKTQNQICHFERAANAACGIRCEIDKPSAA